MIRDLIVKNRSYRRYDESAKISKDDLKGFIDLARLSPFAANLQSLRYMIFNGEGNDKVFDCLGWAGYLTKDKAPVEGERPSAYIVMINKASILKDAQASAGIAAQSILLGAVENGYGGCIFGNVDRDKLSKSFQLYENLEIVYVIALGKPIETVVLEDVKDAMNIKYWRDEDRTHHVPKLSLDMLLLNE